MSPKALDRLGDKFSRDPVCVGPFKFKERVASDRIVLERAPDYYDADRVALRQITFKIITEGPVRASNLRSGDVDVAERLEPIDVVSIKGDDSIHLTERTSLGYQGLTLNVGNRKGTGKAYSTRDTPLAQRAEAARGVRALAGPRGHQQDRLLRRERAGLQPRLAGVQARAGPRVPRPRPREGQGADRRDRREDADRGAADGRGELDRRSASARSCRRWRARRASRSRCSRPSSPRCSTAPTPATSTCSSSAGRAAWTPTATSSTSRPPPAR